jgi:hypothetical protein
MIQGLIYFNFLTWTALTLAFACGCIPPQALWDKTIPGHCINQTACLIASASINLVSDIFIIAVPIAGVMKLQLPTKKKVGVIAIFATGALYEFFFFTLTILPANL